VQSLNSFENVNENAKRLNESVRYKREQNKELKDKLVLVENDC
jgi:hypothetical protein